MNGTAGGMTLSSALNVNGGTLTFALANSVSGTLANPAKSTSFLSAGDKVNFTGTDSIDLVDTTTGGLSLRMSQAYLLISASSSSMFTGLVVENAAGVVGLSQNGFQGIVLGVSDGGLNPLDYTTIAINQFGADGVDGFGQRNDGRSRLLPARALPAQRQPRSGAGAGHLGAYARRPRPARRDPASQEQAGLIAPGLGVLYFHEFSKGFLSGEVMSFARTGRTCDSRLYFDVDFLIPSCPSKTVYSFRLLLIAGLALIHAADTSPEPLLTPAVAGWEKLIAPNGPNQPDVSFSTGADGVAVAIKENGTSGFPGIHVQPATPWDLSAFGRVDATVTNTGEKPMRLSMRVDDTNGETGVTTVALKPGDSRTLKIYLGSASQKAPLKASAISGILLFTGKAVVAQSFRISQIVADGPAGEKPPLDPKTVVTKPVDGVIWNPGTTIDLAKQIVATGGAQAQVAGDQSALQIDFKGGAAESIALRPEMGTWNLNDFFQVRMKFRE